VRSGYPARAPDQGGADDALVLPTPRGTGPRLTETTPQPSHDESATPGGRRPRSAPGVVARLPVLLLAAILGLAHVVPAARAEETALALPAAPSGPCAAGQPTLDTTLNRSILTSIVSSADSAWAVGMTTLAEDPRYALAVEWDGSGWPVMPMRRPKAEQALFAVDRGPRGSLWAAGYRNGEGGYRPMLMRLAQGRWIPMRLGEVGRRTGILTGVTAMTDQVIWAVGYRGARGGQRPLAIRHTADGWAEVDPPLAGGSDGALMDVATAPGGIIWVVGWVSLRGAPHPYAARRIKGRWQVLRPARRALAQRPLATGELPRGSHRDRAAARGPTRCPPAAHRRRYPLGCHHRGLEGHRRATHRRTLGGERRTRAGRRVRAAGCGRGIRRGGPRRRRQWRPVAHVRCVSGFDHPRRRTPAPRRDERTTTAYRVARTCGRDRLAVSVAVLEPGAITSCEPASPEAGAVAGTLGGIPCHGP
jgi:hypothetical protein